MAKFKNKKGGICEVYSLDNIEKLRSDKNYTEIIEKKPVVSKKTPVESKPTSTEENAQESGK